MKQELNEQQWRHYLGMEALRIGEGGISSVIRESGADFKTIRKGMDEVLAGKLYHPGERIRKVGGGKKKLLDTDTSLAMDLDDLLEPKGDPRSLTRWTTNSLANLVEGI